VSERQVDQETVAIVQPLRTSAETRELKTDVGIQRQMLRN